MHMGTRMARRQSNAARKEDSEEMLQQRPIALPGARRLAAHDASNAALSHSRPAGSTATTSKRHGGGSRSRIR